MKVPSSLGREYWYAWRIWNSAAARLMRCQSYLMPASICRDTVGARISKALVVNHAASPPRDKPLL
ncbi:hypothetical protein D3C87_2129220 [compost metagenome]